MQLSSLAARGWSVGHTCKIDCFAIARNDRIRHYEEGYYPRRSNLFRLPRFCRFVELDLVWHSKPNRNSVVT